MREVSVVVDPAREPASLVGAPKLWMPKRVLVTRAALDERFGRGIVARCEALGLDVHELPGNRLSRLRGSDERQTYMLSKSTLAVVVSPPGQRRLQPIPPSADWQFHLAHGCPAHCQYCYLAGSLPGPPVNRVYANLDEILGGLADYEGRGTITSRSAERAGEGTTFEASCYTDPLGLEHLTGGLAATIRHFGTRSAASLRFTTKFAGVDELLGVEHNGRTRVRLSVNAAPVAKGFEGGTASVPQRLEALRRLALPRSASGGGYPVGLTIAPIMPVNGWPEHYGALLDGVVDALSGIADPDLTVELITHRFTPGSKEVLRGWYPASRLEMDEEVRALKRTKFGSKKYVYPAPLMRELRGWFERAIVERLPSARILYWT